MSREVRRVPLGWQHPTTYNEHWLVQSLPSFSHTPVPSRLHAQTERFVGLLADYPRAVKRWEDDLAETTSHEGFDWGFHLEYNLTGYKGHGDTEPTVHPFYLTDDDEDAERGVTVRDEAHLEELLLAKVTNQKPDPADYMPVFDVPEDQLGWCLYSTVTEGTPKTPVFATAEELIEHLATVGEDADEIPLRRSAAEVLVSAGWSAGSFIQVDGGPVLDSARDADLVL